MKGKRNGKKRGFLTEETYLATVKDNHPTSLHCRVSDNKIVDINRLILILDKSGRKKFYDFVKTNSLDNPLTSCGQQFYVSKSLAEENRTTKKSLVEEFPQLRNI